MKICTNCGKELNDDMLFCSVCGQKLEAAPQGDNSQNFNQQGQNYNAQQSQPFTGVPPQQGQQYNQGQQPYVSNVKFDLNVIMPTKSNSILSVNPIINRVKLAGSGIPYFIFLICYSVMAIAGVIHSFTATFPVFSLISSFGGGMGGMGSIFTSNYLRSFSWINIVYRGFCFVQMVPVILITIGIWLFYLKCKNTDDHALLSNGLGFIKIPLFISFGISCLSSIVYVLGIIGFLISEYFKIGALGCFVFLIPQVVIAVYYLMIIKVTTSVNTSITSGISFKISNVLIVFNYIIAVFSLLFGSYGIFGNIVSAGAIIAINICMTAYNKSVDMGNIPQQQPNIYTQAPQ